MPALPRNDNVLEMEETEGLLKEESNATKPAMQAASNSAFCGRWGILMFLLGLGLSYLYYADTSSLRFWEGMGGANVDDVETKPPMSDAPIASPAPISPPEGTPEPTVPPTNPPTIAPPTPDPTPVPTDPPTPDPTPQPTEVGVVAAATNPPTEAAATNPPTEAAATNPPTEAAAASKAGFIDYGANGDVFKKESLVVKPDRTLTPEQESALIAKWGKWELVDDKAASRPKDDMYDPYPNRDIPFDKFPAGAWQTDKDYLTKYFDQGLKLVDRALEAILEEYGHSKTHEPDKSFEERSAMFQLSMNGPANAHNGGWSNEKSIKGLSRRVLHALVTNDSFHAVMGGHSAAAGHGNQFKQSYMMQLHKTVEPVFGMLGVSFKAQNFGRGGLGTLQSSMAMRDEYGDDLDFLVWDSGMTEGRDSRAVDMFHRQSLLSGRKVPFLFGGDQNMMMNYHEKADADVGQYLDAMIGIPEVTGEEQAETIPYAARYIKCNAEHNYLCGANKFHANCWVDRDDVTPPVKQSEKPGSQVKWHPGNRWHQLIGRIMAFTILQATKTALTQWKDAPDFKLADSDWHMTAYYQNIQTKVLAINDSSCHQGFKEVSTRFCDLPVHGRTEFTPRNNPDVTSLISIMKVNDEGYRPYCDKEPLYRGPDVFNEYTAVPEGETDVTAIVSLGRTLEGQRRQLQETQEPGRGWLQIGCFPGYCDGTYNAECARPKDSTCLLSGQSDSRSMIIFDSFSGWGMFELSDFQHGLIGAHFQTWHFPGENTLTADWKTIDGKRRLLRGNSTNNDYNTTADWRINDGVPYDAEEEERQRRLKPMPPLYCDEFALDFSIDGKVTTWNKTETEANIKVMQRVVEIAVFMDDPSYGTIGQPKTVQFGLRMRGCGLSTHKTFGLGHLYWA